MRRDEILTSDSEILGGTPVFSGTRVPVRALLDYLTAGDSLDDFLDGFPSVRRKQAEAILQLAFEATLAEAYARAA